MIFFEIFLFFLDILLKNHLTRAEYGVIINPYFQQKNEKNRFFAEKIEKIFVLSVKSEK